MRTASRRPPPSMPPSPPRPTRVSVDVRGDAGTCARQRHSPVPWPAQLRCPPVQVLLHRLRDSYRAASPGSQPVARPRRAPRCVPPLPANWVALHRRRQPAQQPTEAHTITQLTSSHLIRMRRIPLSLFASVSLSRSPWRSTSTPSASRLSRGITSLLGSDPWSTQLHEHTPRRVKVCLRAAHWLAGLVEARRAPHTH